jgi:hypothetical protein
MTNVTTDMEEDEPNAHDNMGSYGDNVNLGETEDRLARKRLAMQRDGAVAKPLLLMPNSSVATIVGTLEDLGKNPAEVLNTP